MGLYFIIAIPIIIVCGILAGFLRDKIDPMHMYLFGFAVGSFLNIIHAITRR